jgi:nucleotide-binding universal stress UspA family protein
MQPTILVPLDGSAVGEDALPTAAMLARGMGARLHLVHVHEGILLLYSSDLVIGGVPTLNTPIDEQCRSDETAYLHQTAERLIAAGHSVTTALLSGPIDEALARAAATEQAALIVMSTHARGGAARTFMGNLGDVLVRHTSIPLLLVHVQPSPVPNPAPPFRHMLIALDGSPLAEQVLPIAQRIGSGLDLEYTLLHITSPHSSGAELSAIQQYLNGVAARLDAPADKVHTMMMAYRSPAEAIEIYARNHGVDLVVMSTHGRGGLSRLVFGSVADAVIQATQFPVLVYRPALKL